MEAPLPDLSSAPVEAPERCITLATAIARVAEWIAPARCVASTGAQPANFAGRHCGVTDAACCVPPLLIQRQLRSTATATVGDWICHPLAAVGRKVCGL